MVFQSMAPADDDLADSPSRMFAVVKPLIAVLCLLGGFFGISAGLSRSDLSVVESAAAETAAVYQHVDEQTESMQSSGLVTSGLVTKAIKDIQPGMRVLADNPLEETFANPVDHYPDMAVADVIDVPIEGEPEPLGGEGRHAGALNVNPSRVTTTTGALGRAIPNHVPFDGKKLPFADKSVDVIHLENSPIRPDTIAEIQRVLRPGGEIRLVGPADFSAGLHQQIDDAVGGRIFQTTVPTRHGVPSLFTSNIVPAR